MNNQQRGLSEFPTESRPQAQPREHLAPPPTNLPAPTTALIGRDQERADLVNLLRRADVRLVTLTGPGGTGKTRLSLQVATDLLADFGDGVYFVALAPIQEPGLVVATIAQTLGVLALGGQPLLEVLKNYLHDRRMLLVLDNFEQVEAAAPFVAALLAAAPGVKAVITSRAVLRLAGEHEFRVPPLTLPDLAHLSARSDLAQNAAVTLFVERAAAAKASFQLDDANAQAIAEICCRLDGLPLAIELAAARCKLLSPQALLTHWTNTLQVLTGGPRDLPARQQTLRATIDWSYHLLERDEQILFRRLAIFVGGCTLDAAAAVCALDNGSQFLPRTEGRPTTPDPFFVLDRLTTLVEQSLLIVEEQPNGQPRFRMLETIREYALERLAVSGETPILSQLHAHYFLALAEESEPKLTSSEQLQWLARLDQEHDNLRAALTASKDLPGGVEFGLRLAAALWFFWAVRGHGSEGKSWLESLLLQTAQQTPTQALMQLRATALNRAASLARDLADYRRATALGEESLSLARTFGDVRNMAWAQYELGVTMMFLGDYARAQSHYQEGLMLFRALGDSRGIGWTLNDMGGLAMAQGDYTQAAIYHAESLAVARGVGNTRDIAIHLVKEAMIVQVEGNYEQTVGKLNESLVLFRQLKDQQNIPLVLHSLAYVAQLQGDFDRTQKLFDEALHLYERIGNRFGLARCLAGLAAVAEAAGHFARAAQLYGAAAAQHHNISAYLEPAERTDYERSLAAVRNALGEAAFAAAFATGQALSPTQALAATEAALPSPPVIATLAPAPPGAPAAKPSGASTSAAPSASPPAGLTERELEVLRLLAHGLSYTEIADQLVISPRTVNRHLTSIYTKLDVTSRHAATRIAIDHGLV